MISIKGKTSLITGASGGIGASLAVQLAQRGSNLVLVARSADKLEEVKKGILDKYSVKIEVIPQDLSDCESPKALYARTGKLGLDIDILINNAGYGQHKYFIDLAWEKEKAMLDLLVTNLVHLTKLYAKDMVERKFGYVLNVSSTGAFQATPYFSTYSAAKAFVLYFSLAINHELRPHNVRCSALCPGVTVTGFQKAAGQRANSGFMAMTRMTADHVAEIGIKKMLQGKPMIIPGAMNRLNSAIVGMFSKPFAAKVAANMLGEPLDQLSENN